MANTKKLELPLRKALKRAARRKLKALNVTLSAEQRNKLRRARKEKHVGLRAFLKKEG